VWPFRHVAVHAYGCADTSLRSGSSLSRQLPWHRITSVRHFSPRPVHVLLTILSTPVESHYSHSAGNRARDIEVQRELCPMHSRAPILDILLPISYPSTYANVCARDKETTSVVLERSASDGIRPVTRHRKITSESYYHGSTIPNIEHRNCRLQGRGRKMDNNSGAHALMGNASTRHDRGVRGILNRN
jgi:hypothetical protein